MTGNSEQQRNRLFKRIQKHFDERLTPEQQREQKLTSGLRKAARGGGRQRPRDGEDYEDFDEADFEPMRQRGAAAEPARKAESDEPPPTGVLSRPDPHDPRRELVIATGVDVAVVVVTLDTPPLRPGLIDRFLIALERGGVAPLICVNKLDLCDADGRARLAELLAPYTELGIEQIHCSAMSGEGVEDLAAALRGKTCAFVGHSGVGKSSLLNALDPDSERRTGDVREFDGRGRHTTTTTTVTNLGDDTRVLDTPGVRSFGLWKMERSALRHYFAEFESHARSCRFADCSHRHEPDCAVKLAVDADSIAAARYESYARLYQSL